VYAHIMLVVLNTAAPDTSSNYSTK